MLIQFASLEQVGMTSVACLLVEAVVFVFLVLVCGTILW
jgi:hypothetical protein